MIITLLGGAGFMGAGIVRDLVSDRAIVDITIVYPDGTPTFWHFLQGRMHRVVVRARVLPIPSHLINVDYGGDAESRQRFAAWVQQLWQEKDALITDLLRQGYYGSAD